MARTDRAAYTRYAEPFPPASWSSDEKRYHGELMQLFDIIFNWRGRLRADDIAGAERRILLLQAWPVGSVYSTTSTADPGTTLGGEWTKLDETDGISRWERTA